jgi:hypothetical protein
MTTHHHYVLILLALLGISLLSAPVFAGVSADPSTPPRITALAGAVRLEWRGAESAMRARDQPLVTISGVRLPAQLVALRIDGDAPIMPRIDALTSAPWQSNLSIADQPIPQTIDGDARPALAAIRDHSPPASPVVVLRDGRMRGVRIAVLALSPVFLRNGALQVVTALQATIPNAAAFVDDAAGLLARAEPFLTSAPGPTNPAAASTAWKLRVTQTGIQSLPAAALTTAGVSMADPARVHLYHGGAEVALEQRGAGASLELRFYAPPPGDRWNAADSYWLTVEATPGLRMSTRAALPGAAPAGTARDRGVWRDNTLYDSTLPGPDGDHWFATDLKTGPGLPPATLTVPLTQTLSPAPGSTTLILSGSAYTPGQHNLSVTLGGEAHGASWSGVGDWSQTFTFATNSASAVVTLTPGGAPDGVELDGVAWDRPVVLNVGGRGAIFAGAAGSFQYTIGNAAVGRALYDVSDPRAPSVLTIPAGTTTTFEDGPSHQFVLTGPGTLFAPIVSVHQPFDFASPGDVVYIAPAAFQPALVPLVARRQAQGHQVRVIDVQAIYDAWSFGQVAPAAIRDFLRYTAASWSKPPAAVTLVGDGTSDPLNYLRRDSPTFIPPYLAMVDPWLGETACEVCYARLDEADPTADPLPDLALGRLPVKSADELTAVIAKIVAYESSALNVSWRSRNLYVADNYREADNTVDSAGDLAALADVSVAQQPPGVDVRRVYFDPSPSSAGVPWREPDPLRAHERVLAAIDEGAGLVNYVGHASQYQWAVTDASRTPPWLLGLYDTDALTNGARQPIVLEMTCLTSAFQTPAFSKTTIDERLLLKPDGGAVAVWGPTGLGVGYGHGALQRGFYSALWSAPPLSATLGQLTAAGYLELYTHEGCCQETLATFAILGDPLTTVRVLAARQVFAPAVRR